MQPVLITLFSLFLALILILSWGYFLMTRSLIICLLFCDCLSIYRPGNTNIMVLYKFVALDSWF